MSYKLSSFFQQVFYAFNVLNALCADGPNDLSVHFKDENLGYMCFDPFHHLIKGVAHRFGPAFALKLYKAARILLLRE